MLRNSDLPSGAKAMIAPNWPPSPPAGIAPEYMSGRRAAHRRPRDQLGARQRQPAAAVRRRLGISQIDELVGRRKSARATDVEQAALALTARPAGAPATGCFVPVADVDQPDSPRLLGDQRRRSAPGRKAIAHGESKVATVRDRERPLRSPAGRRSPTATAPHAASTSRRPACIKRRFIRTVPYVVTASVCGALEG